ncbi:MAG: hydantoinase B/oxoprolinase family protein, partial [Saprospiraceae bacterium]
HEYVPNSGGVGKWRGGLGVETIIKLGGDNTTMVVFGDGDIEQNYGLFGGKGSILNSIKLTYPDGQERIPLNKDLIEGIPAGTIYSQVAGGGGGYGNPLERELALVEEDIRNEVVDAVQASEEYGLTLSSSSPESSL